ncbi:hypothetical protein DSL72_006355 [Monilinia vaccinii-corymbosi]|uniref:Major facilitator superfamily (MFS) profile domain-containing protein n=1 Tax=Monilinia vaccinii-corymbosi TaxID=61207 RepID=A0A8A3PNS5_9HELO|nr:hypothetical protein DSL72_006355 [Monilinia vaccinii-corymbosi]
MRDDPDAEVSRREAPSDSCSFFARDSASQSATNEKEDADLEGTEAKPRPPKRSMGILNVPDTHEVPGSVLLLTGKRNEPLGLRNSPARTSTSTLPPQTPCDRSRSASTGSEKKLAKDGSTVLEPQPEESSNDPLNWPAWRRDAALLCLGFYCMLGGGMTPILAAGFTNVASTYDVTTADISLTTGLYMMGLGVGSILASPTAILYGKRPVYLGGAILLILSCVWCALSPTYISLLIGRVFQGIALSPIECLPSATIAEIFFLHERAYRIGIYTLLLLGGKNLVPLVSAAVIQTLGWRWVFWVVAMLVGLGWILLFLFVPETFWDRRPRPKRARSRSQSRISSNMSQTMHQFGSRRRSSSRVDAPHQLDGTDGQSHAIKSSTVQRRPTEPTRSMHIGFVPDDLNSDSTSTNNEEEDKEDFEDDQDAVTRSTSPLTRPNPPEQAHVARVSFDPNYTRPTSRDHDFEHKVESSTTVPTLENFNSPYSGSTERSGGNHVDRGRSLARGRSNPTLSDMEAGTSLRELSVGPPYTRELREAPRQTFTQQLKVWNGRLNRDKWLLVAIRPFILFTYPAVLWSSAVYACSIGWLIVLSESVAVIYRSKETYNFSALSTGLIYLSPFIGGVLGTAVAGKVSDVIVRAMSRRNGGLYEPEFRLVMVAPVSITTVIGLMGFGWSAQAHDRWIVPTIFFGTISFGCSLGSTTAITFCVDSYRQYAGEALVTVNFSKNIFHGLVFSLFFTGWLERSGSKSVFIWLGVIQLVLMAASIPMYIWGKRARMWTVRKNWIERFGEKWAPRRR